MPIGEPTSPASQPVAACQRCHRRKKKCDKAFPTCSDCVKSKATCVYETSTSAKDQQKYIQQLFAENAALRQQVQQHEQHQQQQLDEKLQQQLHRPTLLPSPSVVLPPQPSNAWANLSIPLDPSLLSILPAAPVLLAPPQPQTFPNSSTTVASLGTAFASTQPPPTTTPMHGSWEPTLAERVVIQMLFPTWESREKSTTFRETIEQYLGTPESAEASNEQDEEDPTPANSPMTSSAWPSYVLAEKLVNLFFEPIFPAYPVLDKAEVLNDLRNIYSTTPMPAIDETAVPDIRVFRLFMLFAIGCNLLWQRDSASRSSTVLLRAVAIRNFVAVLRADVTTCLSCIVLLAVHSYLDFAATNPAQIIRVASRLALAYEFNKDQPHLPIEEQDARRRVFWSVYSFDRCVAFTLTKPVILPSDMVHASLPTNLGGSSSDRASVEWFRQIVGLRMLQERVLVDVYLRPGPAEQRTASQLRIRNEIDRWYEDTTHGEGWAGRVRDHFFELSYHFLIVTLYRPSPLRAHTDPFKMPLLRKSAERCLELFEAAIDNRLLINNITICQVVVVCVSLIYTLVEYDGDPSNLELSTWRREALFQVDRTESALAMFSTSYPGAVRYRKAFGDLAADIRQVVGDKAAQSPTVTRDKPALPQAQDVKVTPATDVTFGLATGTVTEMGGAQLNHGVDQWMLDGWDMVTSDVTSNVFEPMDLSETGINDLLATLGVDAFGSTF